MEADSPEIGRQTVPQQQAFDKAQMDEVRVDVPMTMTQPTTQSEQVADGMTRKPQVSTKKALLSMMKSPRIAVATWATIVFAITVSALEPTLPLRLQELWSFNSKKVGLVYLSMAIPTIFMSYFSGWVCDRSGAGLITTICFINAIAFYLFLSTREVWFFLLSLIIGNTIINGVSAPLSAEFASIKRSLNEIGYAHVYGAFNIAYGLGTLVGPITAGQIYDRSRHGWEVILCIIAGLLLLTSFMTGFFTGDQPLFKRLLERCFRTPN